MKWPGTAEPPLHQNHLQSATLEPLMHGAKTLKCQHLGVQGFGKTETDVVVPICGVVVVAVRGTNVSGIVVPRAAAQHATNESRQRLTRRPAHHPREDRTNHRETNDALIVACGQILHALSKMKFGQQISPSQHDLALANLDEY
jgi:hypothetical protein